MALTACFLTSCSDDDDTSHEIDIPTNGVDIKILPKAEQEFNALANLLKYDYVCLPIKANPLQLLEIAITINGQQHHIEDIADIIQHSDYEFLIYPKKIEDINDIVSLLKKEVPTCFCKITEMVYDAGQYISCTMPDMDEKWCKMLCGNENPVEVLNEMNNGEEDTNEEKSNNDDKVIGQIQKMYKEKVTTLNVKYLTAKAKLTTNPELQEELQAVYAQTLENMEKSQIDILKDLVEANQKWIDSQK